MELYDVNTKLVIRFVEDYGCPKEAVVNHQRCYTALRAHLVEQGRGYTKELAAQWLEAISGKYCTPYFKYFGKCILQLNDVYDTGAIRREHFPIISEKAKNALIPLLKKTLVDYIDNCRERYSAAYINCIRSRCSRFLIFIQKRGIIGFSQITYELIAEFHRKDSHKGCTSKPAYEASIQDFLLYLANLGECTYGFAWYFYYIRREKVLSLGDFPSAQQEAVGRVETESQDFPSNEFHDLIPQFLGILNRLGYSHSVVSVYNDTLLQLYLFLDMHGLGYHPDIARAWFEAHRPPDRGHASSIYRVLMLFEQFASDGAIMPEQVFTEKETVFDRIPEWCKKPLSDFLAIKVKEQKAKTTIMMYRSANVRFCMFLGEKGLRSFADITPGNVREFNLTDRHRTAEGKNAYNVKIRQFLVYLAEQEFLSNPRLYLVLSCRAAPTERIVVTFTDEEVKDILKFNRLAETPLDFRKKAMLLLGLHMGLRAVDIVNLKLSDIDWKKSAIHLIQKKNRVEICLPMPADAGNALYEYLIKWRPETESSYIFVRHSAPYGKLTSGACRSALESALPERDMPGSGFHATRKTFSTDLLMKGVGASVIVDALGHGDRQSISRYLSLDAEKMKLCPLPLPDTGIPTEGGSRHE